MTLIFYYLIAAAVVVIDQVTKHLAVSGLSGIETYPLIDGVLHLTYVENTGAAFGMMKDSRWVFMVVSAAAIILLPIVIAVYRKRYPFACVCMAMILGGGIGNMIDRVMLGYVVDFIDFRLIHFAVFNGADSFVTVGEIMLVVYMILEFIRESKAERAQKLAAAAADGGGSVNDAVTDGDNDGDTDTDADTDSKADETSGDGK